MIGDLGDGEFRAGRRVLVAAFGDAAQNLLADGQGCLGGLDRVEFLRRGGPLVGPGIAAGAGLGKPVQVVVPALAVAGGLLVGQAVMDQPDQRAVGRGLQGDGHRRRARRQLSLAFPAPGEDDALARLDLGEGRPAR